MKLADHVNEKLEDAGITTPQAALDAGADGLRAIHGIGQKTAEEILVAAEAALAEEAEAAGDDEPEAAPPAETETIAAPDQSDETTPDWVEVKLTGAHTSTIAGFAIWQNDTRRVRYHHYRQAAAANPGIFLVRRVGEREYREAL